jgi:PAS domain S-box-containing protein
VAVLIEHRKGVERSLRESEERVQIAAQTSGLGFWIWDPMTGHVWASDKLGELLGMAPGEEVNYQSFLAQIVPEDRALVASEVNQSVAFREDLDIEYRVRLPDGGVRWITSRGRGHQDDDSEPWRLVGTCMNTTAQRQAAAEMELQREELAHLSRVAALSALSGSLAHELNQPLGSILSNAQAAQHLMSKDAPDLTELRAILGDIISEDRRAGEVIKRLRTMLRRGEVAVQPVNVNENLGELLRLARSDLNARDVAVTCLLAKDLPLAMTDRVQLQQVVLNLVMNACDAMESIPPEQRRLTLTTFVAQNEVRIGVLDCGVGLPEDVEALFQPFHTTKSGGLGLGLSICRMLVSAHGGRLWVERRAECGAAFYVALPQSKENP